MRSMLLVLAVVAASAVSLGAEPPGNVFLEGEAVSVAVPEGLSAGAVRWQCLDDRGQVVAGAEPGAAASPRGRVALGSLGIGWYRVEFLDAGGAPLGWTTAAVLGKLAAPTPPGSPICVDAAAAWFARDDAAGQAAFASLAARAGVSMVRDRLKWRDIAPRRDAFAERTTYDTAADAQAAAGLSVLQVFHDTAPWAAQDGESRGRFAPDLRDVYRFCEAMARRFKGRVQAWEPWNEANVPSFGGHTADEMCSFQKAAYLGFTAGDPAVTVCWNVTAAVPTLLHARLVLANETWPYFDTYNIHTYDWPHSYEELWAPVPTAACDRPLWVTEADRGTAAATDPPWSDLSRELELRKAEFMAQSYATSLFLGTERHFHFILGHYTEGKIQFGLLRRDMTPRPAYVALAALGRLLAGAQCLGRWRMPNSPDAHAYAFRAAPDGTVRDVIVAWAEKPVDWPERGTTQVSWSLPKELRVEAAYDYLGRSLGAAVPERLGGGATFVVLPAGASSALPLETRPRASLRPGTPCPVVLQLLMPKESAVKVERRPWALEHEHLIATEKETELPLFAYNFGGAPREGSIAVEHLPAGWTMDRTRWDVRLEPFDRAALQAKLTRPAGTGDAGADVWVGLRGDFGPACRPVLTFRLIAAPGEGYDAPPPTAAVSVGVAAVDITPETPVRLYGYASRTIESEGVAGRLRAKAFAIGDERPAVLLSVESGAVPDALADEVFARLAKRANLTPERFVLCVTHNHSGPNLKGAASLPADQRGRLERYGAQVADRLEDVVVRALDARRPAHLALAEGAVRFAANRRVLKDGKWSGFGAVLDAPVDHRLPVLRVTDTAGTLMAVAVNYACHATTLRPNFTRIHGDWAGCAQEDIEAAHPGALALISIGCGADADPYPHGTVELADQHGRAVADEVERLLAGPFQPVSPALEARRTVLRFPFVRTGSGTGGEEPPPFEYPITVWRFGPDLAMVFLAGEVVVDYADRLRREFPGLRLWITAYAHRVPCYVASDRLIAEGGYEVINSISARISGSRPETVIPSIENQIVAAVGELLATAQPERP